MIIKQFNLPYLVFLLLLSSIACRKGILNEDPDSSDFPMTTLEHAQAILDNTDVMYQTPVLSEISADNYYMLYENMRDPVEESAYLWQKNFPTGGGSRDWNMPYGQILRANMVLEKFPDLIIEDRDQDRSNYVKGMALFIRAYAFHNLALQYANLYDSSTAKSSLGIPLRLSADFGYKYERATVEQTYQRILADINDALQLLPATPDSYRTNRPSAPAAYALLARVYLSMSDYKNAKLYADSCLMTYSKLIDYNILDKSTAINPFRINNEEILYQSNLDIGNITIRPGYCIVDSILYNSYDNDDLRKSLFFTVATGVPIIGHSYSTNGGAVPFSGLAVDEVVLIRSECKARLKDQSGAIHDLVTLLKKRWKNGAYTLPSVNTPDEILQLILKERRKELVFRGLRWSDIRRLNKEGANISLKRIYNQQLYILPAGDPRFVLPIPNDVIAHSKMEQNPR